MVTPRTKTKNSISGRFVDENQVAAITGISVGTLRKWRVYGRGPKFRKFGGAVRYDLGDLEKWIQTSPAGGGTTPNNRPAA
jgi:predicted DNA-binding transcriptional regulator AlpA